jgi:Tol biopolymer transport system component
LRTAVFSLTLGLWAIAPAAVGSSSPASHEARFLSRTRQLIFEGRRSGEGYFSPDGKTLVFQSEREPGNPFYQIYLLDLSTGDTHRLSPGTGKTTCAFFRPGTDEVLFTSSHLDPEASSKQKAELDFRASGKERRYSWDYDEHMDLFIARRDGSGLRRLTEAQGYDAEASFSPDGGTIVFTSLRDAYPAAKLSERERKQLEVDPAYFAEIYIMNADGSSPKRLTRTPGYDGGPFFSPDGRRIIWRRFDESGMNADVYTMNLEGGDVRRLTDFGSMSWAPYFHPSGRYAIFTSNKLGFTNFELYLVDAEGRREPVRVTFTDGFDGLPVFSPDGNELCWTSNRSSSGQSQLFLSTWNHEAALAALEEAPLREQPAVTARPDAAVEVEALRKHVGFLAGDALEGRRTGSEGARLAADYAAEQFRAAGLQPAGDTGSFLQAFEFTAGSSVVAGKNALLVETDGAGATSFEVDEDFRPLSFTTNGQVEGEVVFAGYGLFVPGPMGEGYDSYAGVDVKDRIVLVLRYVPEQVAPERRQALGRYGGLRYKAMQARERGARAILVVTGPNSPNAGELTPLSFDTSLADSGIVAASVSSRVAHALLSSSGKRLAEIQTTLDDENPHAEGSFPLPKTRVSLRTELARIRKDDRNVVAYLPPAHGATAEEEILLGAHYDHLGRGDDSSLARKEEAGEIHNGADDNASGAALLLELAASLAARREQHPELFRRGIRFALWSGEEIGLLGSSHFAADEAAMGRAVAYLNFDMVGRLRNNKLVLQGVGSSAAWRPLVEKRNVAAAFDLSLQDDPYLPTDATSLYLKRVPVLNVFTGAHEDYHRPTDDPERLDYEGMARIGEFARALVLDLVQSPVRPDWVEIQQTTRGGSRDSLRAYLGTIPDYATEVQGVKLSGVRGGSPADRAGLQAGDVIVRFAGQDIKNIYDYTFALDAVKVGEAVELEVLRNGDRLKFEVMPEARK